VGGSSTPLMLLGRKENIPFDLFALFLQKSLSLLSFVDRTDKKVSKSFLMERPWKKK